MFRLNNPGGGDCLFYALSTGLIDAIQKAPEAQGRDLWQRWATLGGLSGAFYSDAQGIQQSLCYEDIMKIDLHSNPLEINELKTLLQLSLRKIAADSINTEYQDFYDETYVASSPQYQAKQSAILELNAQLAEFDKQFKLVEELEEPAYELDHQITKFREKNGYKDDDEVVPALRKKIKELRNEEKYTSAVNTLETLRETEDIKYLRTKRSDLMHNRLLNDKTCRNFISLVHAYRQNASAEQDQYNIFYISPEVSQLAQKMAKKTTIVTDDDLIKEIITAENRQILENGVNEIRRASQWGNAEHCGSILTALKLNSTIQTKKNGTTTTSTDLTFGVDSPVIYLINKDSKHWTTGVETAAPKASNTNTSQETVTSATTPKPADTSSTPASSPKVATTPVQPTTVSSPKVTATPKATASTVQQAQVSSPKAVASISKSLRETVIEATSSTQLDGNKANAYRIHLNELMNAAEKEGFFATVKKPIDIKNLDSATANAGETDEEFATRLQEAEFRAAKLK